MNYKNIIAIAIVVILIVAATGAILLAGNDDSGEVNETGRLLVYGNANNDDYLDERDIEFIESIISGEMEWDEDAYPFADANCDGVVDSADIDQINMFLNNEESYMYYQDSWGTVSYVHYPITGNIGVMDWRQADLTVSLGLWDRVVACGTAGMNEKKTPGYTDIAIWGSGYYVDTETVIETANTYGLDVVLAYDGDDGTGKELHDNLLAADTGIDVIAVDRTDIRVMVMTTAVLLGADEAGQKYVEYCDKIVENIVDKTMDMPEEDVKSVCLIMMYSTSTPSEVSVLCNSDNANKLFQILYNYTPTELVTPVDYSSTLYSRVDIEFVIDRDPDVIVVLVASSMWSGDVTEEEVQSSFLNYCDEYFSNTTAYQTGNIIATDSTGFGGQMCYFTAYKVLSMIYPDYISPEEGDEVYADWHDEGFAIASLDDLPGQKVRMLSDYMSSLSSGTAISDVLIAVSSRD